MLVWVAHLIAPDAVTITFNEAPATGWSAFLVPVVLSAILGLILGLVVAGVTALVTRSSTKG